MKNSKIKVRDKLPPSYVEQVESPICGQQYTVNFTHSISRTPCDSDLHATKNIFWIVVFISIISSLNYINSNCEQEGEPQNRQRQWQQRYSGNTPSHHISSLIVIKRKSESEWDSETVGNKTQLDFITFYMYFNQLFLHLYSLTLPSKEWQTMELPFGCVCDDFWHRTRALHSICSRSTSKSKCRNKIHTVIQRRDEEKEEEERRTMNDERRRRRIENRQYCLRSQFMNIYFVWTYNCISIYLSNKELKWKFIAFISFGLLLFEFGCKKCSVFTSAHLTIKSCIVGIIFTDFHTKHDDDTRKTKNDKNVRDLHKRRKRMEILSWAFVRSTTAATMWREQKLCLSPCKTIIIIIATAYKIIKTNKNEKRIPREMRGALCHCRVVWDHLQPKQTRRKYQLIFHFSAKLSIADSLRWFCRRA